MATCRNAPAGKLLAGQGERDPGASIAELQRAFGAQHLFDRRAHQGRVGGQPRALVRVAQQQVDAVGNQAGGGVVAGIEHEDAVVDDLQFAQSRAGVMRLDQCPEDVGVLRLRRMRPLPADQLAQVGLEIFDRPVAGGQLLRCALGVQSAQDEVGPFAQGLTLFARHAQQIPDQVQRHGDRELADDVQCAPVGGPIEQFLDHLRHPVLEPAQGLGREKRREQFAHSRVIRRVVEHERHRVVLVERAVAELGPEVDLLVRTEPLGVGEHFTHIVIAADDPRSVGLRAQRRVFAQRREVRIRVARETRRWRRQDESGRRVGSLGHGVSPARAPCGWRWCRSGRWAWEWVSGWWRWRCECGSRPSQGGV
jgi:hypothetical protein